MGRKQNIKAIIAIIIAVYFFFCVMLSLYQQLYMGKERKCFCVEWTFVFIYFECGLVGWLQWLWRGEMDLLVITNFSNPFSEEISSVSWALATGFQYWDHFNLYDIFNHIPLNRLWTFFQSITVVYIT